jgi:hypothetical protein
MTMGALAIFNLRLSLFQIDDRQTGHAHHVSVEKGDVVTACPSKGKWTLVLTSEASGSHEEEVRVISGEVFTGLTNLVNG